MGVLISRQLPALHNGVSQQPATLRLPSQSEAVINGYGTVVDGMRKRPAFENVAKVTSNDLSSAFIHAINRDTTERYIVVVTDGVIQVFDSLTGAAKTVNNVTWTTFPLSTAVVIGQVFRPATPNGFLYRVTTGGTTGASEPTWVLQIGGTTASGSAILTCVQDYLYVPPGQSAADTFACVSVADYTFVVNKSIQVLVRPTPSSPPVNYDDWYRPKNWGKTNENIKYSDPLGGVRTYKGKKQTFSELPKDTDVAPKVPPAHGDVWEIAGYDEDNFGSYYVIRNGTVWEETWGINEGILLDENSMPHALVREEDGTFSFKEFIWEPRRVGNGKTNPPPTFVGNTVNDVFYYKNRLGLVSGENVIFSGAGDYGNFWRTTMTDLLDSDVVDVAVSSTQVSQLEFAVPFNSGLMLFADQTQFSLNVDTILTPTSVSIDTATSYEMNSKVRPVGIGSDVYFVTESGQYSRVREYFVQEDGVSADATDITAHVPAYLPKGINRLAGNANEDVLFAISNATGYKNRIYVYKFFWADQEKLQSAWQYWELQPNDVVLSIDVLENQLFVLIKRADGTYLEKCNVQSGSTAPGMSIEVLLDRLTTVTGSYLGTPDYTQFTLPYPVVSGERPNFRLVRGAGYTGQVGALVDPTTYTWVNDTTVRIPGNQAGTCLAGMKYTMTYTFSEQFVKNGEIAVTTGRLMLRTFTIYFTDSAFFKTSVAPYGNDPLVESVVPASLSEFTGKTLGEGSLILGAPVYHTGRYSFQVYGDSKVAKVSLLNDTHVQSKFQSAEWEALYHNRAGAA